MQEAGITRDTKNPSGGEILHDKAGNPMVKTTRPFPVRFTR